MPLARGIYYTLPSFTPLSKISPLPPLRDAFALFRYMLQDYF